MAIFFLREMGCFLVAEGRLELPPYHPYLLTKATLRVHIRVQHSKIQQLLFSSKPKFQKEAIKHQSKELFSFFGTVFKAARCNSEHRLQTVKEYSPQEFVSINKIGHLPLKDSIIKPPK